MPSPVATLHDQLHAAGIPVVTVSRGEDRAFRIDFAPEATDKQKAQAAQIVAAFDPDTKPAPPTKRERLEKVLGITLEEFKAELPT